MSGTRGGRGRIVAMGVALALALLLVGRGEARAGKYAVAQCGWHLGARRRLGRHDRRGQVPPDSYCATPPAPTLRRRSPEELHPRRPTVSGTRFARWRWKAPRDRITRVTAPGGTPARRQTVEAAPFRPLALDDATGTGIVAVRGSWSHTLHDGFEHRLGTDGATAASPRVGGVDRRRLRDFAAGFSPPQWAFEDRLLCARAESKSCSLAPGSWSALRALTITVEDDGGPDRLDRRRHHRHAAGCAGRKRLQAWGADVGGGVRFGETYIDGARVALTEYPCAKVMIGGEWRATRDASLRHRGRRRADDRHRPASATAATSSSTASPTSPATSAACPARTIRDRQQPARSSPRAAVLAGGEGWRRVNDFDLAWANPDQGGASPICGRLLADHRPAGYDSGVGFAGGRDVAARPRPLRARGRDLLLPRLAARRGRQRRAGHGGRGPAALRRRAARASPSGGRAAPGFRSRSAPRSSTQHSGPAGGEIRYRRLGTDSWTELPARFVRGAEAGRAQLVARLPESLAAGTYVFQAEAADGAGNAASTTRRADGTEMTLRKPPPPPPRTGRSEGGDGQLGKVAARAEDAASSPACAGAAGAGTSVTVPFGAAAVAQRPPRSMPTGPGSPGGGSGSSRGPREGRWRRPPSRRRRRPGSTAASGSSSRPAPRAG